MGRSPPTALLAKPLSSLLFSCGVALETEWPNISVCLFRPQVMPHDIVDRTLRFFSDMDCKRLAALSGAVAVIYGVYRRYSGISLDDVPGPENPSFLHGTSHSYRQRLLSSQCARGECGVTQGISHLCRMLRQGSSRAVTWPHTAASYTGMGPSGYVNSGNQTLILPRLRLLTGDTVNRNSVCGSPTPRLSPISCVLGIYGSKPPPIAR